MAYGKDLPMRARPSHANAAERVVLVKKCKVEGSVPKIACHPTRYLDAVDVTHYAFDVFVDLEAGPDFGEFRSEHLCIVDRLRTDIPRKVVVLK